MKDEPRTCGNCFWADDKDGKIVCTCLSKRNTYIVKYRKAACEKWVDATRWIGG